MKSKVPVSQTPSNAESAAEPSDAFAPAVLTEAQAAVYVGETPHQLAVRRRKGTAPPFIMHGVRVRYPLDDLKQWLAQRPRFTSRAAALVANPARAKSARKQAATSAQAREARWPKRRDASAKSEA
jgi:hypothetical protein